MHILSEKNRSEFLATPQLIRFTYAQRSNGFEPTLLIKGSTLLLKYVSRGARMQLAFSRIGRALLYALKIYDDGPLGGVLWSVLETTDEQAAIEALLRGQTCQIFLFNELAVNVAWTERDILIAPGLAAMTADARIGHVDHSGLRSEAHAVIDRFHTEDYSSEDLIVAELQNSTNWKLFHNVLITRSAIGSPIDFENKDEGGQQEQLGVWLTDNLHCATAQNSPQIPKGKKFRELTDIILSHEFGLILIESKTLTIFARDNLPARAKLTRDLSGHITKAVNQLRGGIRRLKDGTPVSNKKGELLDVERTKPMHAIVLVPDLDLITEKKTYGIEFARQFMEATGGFLHIVDVSELLRIVQAGEMIAARSKLTHMMAFDYYLIERAKKVAEIGTLCIEVLLCFED